MLRTLSEDRDDNNYNLLPAQYLFGLQGCRCTLSSAEGRGDSLCSSLQPLCLSSCLFPSWLLFGVPLLFSKPRICFPISCECVFTEQLCSIVHFHFYSFICIFSSSTFKRSVKVPLQPNIVLFSQFSLFNLPEAVFYVIFLILLICFRLKLDYVVKKEKKLRKPLLNLAPIHALRFIAIQCKVK